MTYSFKSKVVRSLRQTDVSFLIDKIISHVHFIANLVVLVGSKFRVPMAVRNWYSTRTSFSKILNYSNMILQEYW